MVSSGFSRGLFPLILHIVINLGMNMTVLSPENRPIKSSNLGVHLRMPDTMDFYIIVTVNSVND